MRIIGVFGGTFDPIHCGHLRVLLELVESGLDEVLVIPVGEPPHRAAPIASAAARISMLDSALDGLAQVRVDAREVERAGPSYTIDTLESLRAEYPDEALALILGADAFAGLPSWHRWEEIPDLAHILVARRPGAPERWPQELAQLVKRGAGSVGDLRESGAGKVVFCETSQLDVSSSHLRSLAAAGRSLKWLVPGSVERLIEEHEWYRVKN